MAGTRKGPNRVKPSTRNQAQGKAREVAGAVKQKAGRALRDPDMETQGAVDRAGGKIQKKVGQIQKVFNR